MSAKCVSNESKRKLKVKARVVMLLQTYVYRKRMFATFYPNILGWGKRREKSAGVGEEKKEGERERRVSRRVCRGCEITGKG